MVGTVAVPGSKSVTNRALVLGALAEGTSRLRTPLRSRDTELMAAALRALGVQVRDEGADWVVTGGGLHAPEQPIDAGNAGTVARFLPPLAALAKGDVAIDGDPRIRQRPLRPLIDALRQLGVEVDDGGRGTLPILVRGAGRVAGGQAALDASASSQFVSGLLLTAPAFERPLQLRSTRPVPSAHHLEMTVQMLWRFGARVSRPGPERWLVDPGPLSALDVEVEPDLSSAAPFLAAAAVTGGRVRVPGWPRRSIQPGAVLPELLARFGARAEHDSTGLTVSGGELSAGADLDLSEVGELTPVLAAVAALAGGESRLSGVAHLRGQESDRLAALARELSGLGGRVRETEDGLVIRPAALRAGRFRTYDDHRLVMAAAVLGLAVPGLRVAGAGTVAKTFPDFEATWTAMLGQRP